MYLLKNRTRQQQQSKLRPDEILMFA